MLLSSWGFIVASGVLYLDPGSNTIRVLAPEDGVILREFVPEMDVIQDSSALSFDGFTLSGYSSIDQRFDRVDFLSGLPINADSAVVSGGTLIVGAARAPECDYLFDYKSQSLLARPIGATDFTAYGVSTPETTELISDIAMVTSGTLICGGSDRWVYSFSASGGLAEPVFQMDFNARSLTYLPGRQEVFAMRSSDSTVRVYSWPNGELLRTWRAPIDGLIVCDEWGLSPRQLAPPAPWIDENQDGVADWFVDRFAGSRHVIGDVNQDGAANMLDALLFNRDSQADVRWDFNLDGALDLSDAEALRLWSIGLGKLPTLE